MGTAGLGPMTSALSELLHRDEDAKDELIRQQQSEIARLRAENDSLRARLESGDVSPSSGVRRVSSGVGFSSRLFASGKSPLSKIARSAPMGASPPTTTLPPRPLSEINSGAPPLEAARPTRMRTWSGSIRSSTSLPHRLDEMDIVRHGGPIEPANRGYVDSATGSQATPPDFLMPSMLSSTTLSPIPAAMMVSSEDVAVEPRAPALAPRAVPVSSR